MRYPTILSRLVNLAALCLLALVLGIVPLAGCGPQNPPANDDNGADTDADGTADDGDTDDGVDADDGSPSVDPHAEITLDQWIADLSSDDDATRIEAIEELGRFKAEAKPAVAALIQALGDENADIRWRAALTLGAIGPDAQAAVAPLVAALQNKEDDDLRAYAAFALGAIGDKAESTWMPLIASTKDPNKDVRLQSIRALGKIKPPRDKTIPMFKDMLADAEPSVVMPVLHTLAEIGEEVVPFLVEALENKEACYWACLALSEIATEQKAGQHTQSAVDGLVKASQHEEAETRLQALIALGEFGPAAKSAVPRIVDALDNDIFDGAQYAAAYALGKIGVAEPATASLEKAAGSDDAFLKMVAVQSLARLQPDNEEAVRRAADEMAKALASDDPLMQAAAARGLAEFGGSSENTAPALETALATATPEVIANAMNAFVELGAKAAPRVANGLKNEKLRHYAIRVLTRIGPEASAAIPKIIEALKNDEGGDPVFRAELQFALGAIGSTNADAVGELTESLASDNDEVRHSACYALGRIGPAAEEAAPALEKHLDGEDDVLALFSALSLVRIRPGDKGVAAKATPLLANALTNEREQLRILAATALGDIGPDAKAAIPALEKAQAEGDDELKKAATEALAKING